MRDLNLSDEEKKSCFELAKSETWKDTTTHSRDDKERIPTIFELATSDIRVVIVRGHMYYPDKWIMQIYPGNSIRVLKARNAIDAASMALMAAREYFGRISRDLNNINLNP